jgi:hypothetical protein
VLFCFPSEEIFTAAWKLVYPAVEKTREYHIPTPPMFVAVNLLDLTAKYPVLRTFEASRYHPVEEASTVVPFDYGKVPVMMGQSGVADSRILQVRNSNSRGIRRL